MREVQFRDKRHFRSPSWRRASCSSQIRPEHSTISLVPSSALWENGNSPSFINSSPLLTLYFYLTSSVRNILSPWKVHHLVQCPLTDPFFYSLHTSVATITTQKDILVGHFQSFCASLGQRQQSAKTPSRYSFHQPLDTPSCFVVVTGRTPTPVITGMKSMLRLDKAEQYSCREGRYQTSRHRGIL